MASLSSTVFHRPFTPSTINSSTSPLSSSPSLIPSSISFRTPQFPSKALRKATLISAGKDGLPSPVERPNPLQFLRQTTVLLTASAALLGCLSSPCYAKPLYHNPDFFLLEMILSPRTRRKFRILNRLNPGRVLPSMKELPSIEIPEKPETVGNVENSAKEEVEKEKVLEEYRVSNPDDVNCLKALIGVKIKLGKLEEAISVVESLMELDPTSKDWPLMRAHMRIYEGDVEGAKLAFEEIIEQNYLYVEAYHGLITAASKMESKEELEGVAKRIEAAIKECKKEKKKEDLREFRFLTADIQVVEGKYEEALKVYEELVKEEPRDFRPYLYRGIIYMLLKKKDEAEKQFEKYRRLVPIGHPAQKLFHDNMILEKFLSKMEDNLFNKR